MKTLRKLSAANIGKGRRLSSVVLMLLLIVLLATGLVGCDQVTEQISGEDSAGPTPLPPVLSEGYVTAEGKVVPVQYANLSFSMSGAIAEIMVEEGDYISEGDLIASLEGRERLEAALVAAELELLSAQQALDTLHDDADLRKASAQLALAEAENEVDDATDRLASKDFKRGDEDEIAAAWAEIVLAEKALERVEDDFEEVANKAENDFGRAQELSRLAQARQRRDDAWTRYNALNEEPDELEIAEAEAELKVAQENLKIVQEDWEELQDGLDDDELERAESRLKAAQAQLVSTKLRLEDIELRAPFDGSIVVSNLEVGELVSPGTAVVLADENLWEVETTDLTELDVVGIEAGMPVEITVDALPEVVLTGVIERIKILGETKQGDVTYRVVVKLDEQDERLRWNMTTMVTFIGEDE